MDESALLNGVLSAVLGGRGPRRRSRRAMNYLTGGGRGSFWTNPSTLLTAAGVAWGIYETMQQSAGQASTVTSPTVATPPPPPASTAASVNAPASPSVSAPANSISLETLRIVRLAVSAAYADGSLNDIERAAILDHANTAGVADIVEAEMQQPRPLAEIVSGVTDAAQRATMYVLAYSMVRGDEQPTGAERIYLAQLANLLGIDVKTVQELEQQAASRIDAQPA
jgi:uncharacterized membrane protein YebE (DUF533 family)